MTETLPLFPLGAVLLPGASMPLHIFEPRYRQLVVDLVKGVRPDRAFGVVSVRQGWDIRTDDMAAVHPVGCSALLREARQLPEGRYDIVVRGHRRFRLVDVDHSAAPYLVAEVEWLPDSPVTDHDLVAKLADLARAAHRGYCATAWREEDWREPCTTEDLTTLANVLAEDCLLSLDDRQQLLEEGDPVRRLRMVRGLLKREAEILRALRAVPAPLSEFAADFANN
ncbi:LON peptidase substrate-binding domain-containing protein [Allokutzneria sp. NRRL B-24872]|uniref:LON peptidase substrate-binding domain-containing protein n=1 Tax=Allokutzneria sp. NRRL B-24872 TaxID=1137961 RepID=UPI000A370913|nr:LON peptidase substrate-binding domain-containing protein [Allokutzneria sp. NRRL B-24872]